MINFSIELPTIKIHTPKVDSNGSLHFQFVLRFVEARALARPEIGSNPLGSRWALHCGVGGVKKSLDPAHTVRPPRREHDQPEQEVRLCELAQPKI